jgi:hypothetical protein
MMAITTSSSIKVNPRGAGRQGEKVFIFGVLEFFLLLLIRHLLAVCFENATFRSLQRTILRAMANFACQWLS